MQYLWQLQIQTDPEIIWVSLHIYISKLKNGLSYVEVQQCTKVDCDVILIKNLLFFVIMHNL